MRKLLMAALVGTVLSGTAQAGFTGQQVSGQELFPNTASPFGFFGPAVVGGGVEFTGIGDFSTFSIDISDDAVLIRNDCGGCSFVAFNSAAFNGYLLINLTADWPDFTITAALPGFTAADVTVSGGNLFVNFADVSFPDGGFVRLTAQPAAVPAPGALPLMVVALGGLALAMRRRAT